MKPNQRQTEEMLSRAAKERAWYCRRAIERVEITKKRDPAGYGCLQLWLFANMTLDQLEYLREDPFYVPRTFMSDEEAVILLHHFFDEIRERFDSYDYSEELTQKDDESFAWYARRLVEYAISDIIANVVHDDVGDLGMFLAAYQS